MITTEEILNMNFYKKEKFTGSYLGMRYLIKKDVIETPVEDGEEGEVNKTDIFRAYVWPGPYAFSAVAEEDKTSATFPFTEEGKQQVVDWLNEQWQIRKDFWSATMMH